jgi:hypothetical protein
MKNQQVNGVNKNSLILKGFGIDNLQKGRGKDKQPRKKRQLSDEEIQHVKDLNAAVTGEERNIWHHAHELPYGQQKEIIEAHKKGHKIEHKERYLQPSDCGLNGNKNTDTNVKKVLLEQNEDKKNAHKHYAINQPAESKKGAWYNSIIIHKK